jgi:protein-disulfide isomerase
MKKKIGLLAIIGLLVSFMAFSGVASAQSSNVQVVFFTSPYCSACNAAHPIVQAAAAKYGVTLVTYDVSTAEGKGIATANGVSETPTIIVSGAQSARFAGSVSQAQMEAAIKAAIGTATPTPKATVKQAVATPKAPTTVKQAAATKPTTPYIGNTETHVVHLANCYHVDQMKVANMKGFNTLADAQAQGYTPCKDCLGVKATVTPAATKTVAKATAQPTIEVVTATQAPTTSTQTVPEFSLLGLGAPALVVGAIYLFLRRR